MPHEGWALFCVTCFWGWIAATTVFLVKSLPGRNGFSPRPARLWGMGVILVYGLWVLAMTQV